MNQPHKIILHYHGDGGQMCVDEQTEIITEDVGAIIFFKIIQNHQSPQAQKVHFCANGGISLEIVPLTRKVQTV